MKNKIYFLKFSLISFVFCIVAVVMHLFPGADLLFIKKSHGPEDNRSFKKDPKNPLTRSADSGI